jgi:hypothetical protein
VDRARESAEPPRASQEPSTVAIPLRKRFASFMVGAPLEQRPPPPRLLEPPSAGKLGICCSGGGVRSAAYNMGALQALQEAEELQKARYLSAVSGGSYIAAARAVVATQTSDKSLFNQLPPYAMGSPEEQWLRNHSSYLAPGLTGKVQLLVRLLTGMGINVALLGLFLFIAARPLGWAYGKWLFPHAPWHGANPLKTVRLEMWLSAGIPAGLGTAFALSDLLFHPPARWHQFLTAWAGRFFTVAAFPLVFVVVLPYLVLLLQHLRDLRSLLAHLSSASGAMTATKKLAPIANTPGIPTIVWPALGTLALSALRILWARKRATVALAVAGIVGPLTILVTFVWFASAGARRPGRGWWLWLLLLALFIVIFLFSDLTNWSGHPFYKRRLAEAYAVKRVSNAQVEPVFGQLLKLSESQPPGPPTLLVCAAANLSEKGVTPPGRRADTFTFTSNQVGGPIVGYVETEELEDLLGDRRRDMTLMAAVAMSGAAVSPSMGKLTIPPLRFLLGIMGVRLGVWLPNPRRFPVLTEEHPEGFHWYNRPRLYYLAKELFGRNDLNDNYLYVTDGGHYENLGLVELLRRGCTQIYCFDASGEEDNTFYTLGQALAIARADLKVEIEIDPSPICATIIDDCNEKERLAAEDHVSGTITYRGEDGDTIKGCLVYAKAAVTRKAPYEIRAFRQRDPKFPHHPTFDQLFNDEKFEAYWALGRHTAKWAMVTMTDCRAKMDLAPARPSPGGLGTSGEDSIDQVRRLAQLRDDGLITEDQFEKKKKELLGL